MADITSSLGKRLRALWADRTILPAVNVNLRRIVVAVIVLPLAAITLQQTVLSAPDGVLLLAIFLVGSLCAYSLQFVVNTRGLVVLYGGGLAAIAVLIVADLPILAIIALQFILPFIFYRFPLRSALLLGTIPTATFVLLAYTVHQESANENASSLLFVIFLVYVFDIVVGSARRQNAVTNRHLTWTREQLDREMASNAHLAVMRERTRIARDMHDILAHSLTALSVQLQAARQTVTHDPTQTIHLLDEMAINVAQSVAESRQLIQVLREATAPEEADLTLVAQLQRIGDRFSERTGLRVTVSEHGQARIVSDEEVVALRFIVQEVLTNAFKHGNAHQMILSLDWQDVSLFLTAKDDGTRQAAQTERGDGHGLQGMHERMAALGGTMVAGPRTDGPSGFAVRITVPFQWMQEKQAV